MELDNLERNDGSWDSQPMKITGIITIVLSSLITLLFLYIFFQIQEFRVEIENELAKQNQDVDVDDIISMIKGIFLFLTIPFILSIVGASLMLKKSNNGWILFLIAHVIIILFLFLGLIGNANPTGIFLFIAYLTLTILAGRYRYKPEENFEEYSN